MQRMLPVLLVKGKIIKIIRIPDQKSAINQTKQKKKERKKKLNLSLTIPLCSELAQ